MIKKKLSALICTAALTLGVLVSPAAMLEVHAEEAFNQLTLQDSKDFTIVGEIDDTEDMMVKGLTSTWQKVDIENIDNVIWTTSDSDIVTLWDTDTEEEVNSIPAKEEVTVKLKGEGRATITASYGDMEIKSFIVVEGEGKDLASNITVNVKGEKTKKYNFNGDIELFSLVDIYGSNFDNSDQLKNSPSAVHALIKAYIDKESKKWVKSNIKFDPKSEGTVVTKIGEDENFYNADTYEYTGWQYDVNGNKIDHAASIYELEDDDIINWVYKLMEW